MGDSLARDFANPSGLYRLGRQSRQLVEEAREKVARLVNAHPSQVIFTGSGTEANNLAVKGCVAGMRLGRLAYSVIEHPSVRNIGEYLSKTTDVTPLCVDAAGRVDRQAVAGFCQESADPGLLSVMLANNETGVVQDVGQIAQIAREAGHIVHTDAVQGLGKIPVDFRALGVNLMSLSAHKLYGPKGVGALVYDKSLPLVPLLHGGGQEKGLRSGTENVAGIVGFGVAAEIAHNNLQANSEKLKTLRDLLELELMQLPGVVVFARDAERLPNTTFMGCQGIDGETLLMQLDAYDIAVASGSACSSKSGKPSHVLLAMGVDEQLAQSAIRISLGIGNTQEQVRQFVTVLNEIIKRLKPT